MYLSVEKIENTVYYDACALTQSSSADHRYAGIFKTRRGNGKEQSSHGKDFDALLAELNAYVFVNAPHRTEISVYGAWYGDGNKAEWEKLKWRNGPYIVKKPYSYIFCAYK